MHQRKARPVVVVSPRRATRLVEALGRAGLVESARPADLAGRASPAGRLAVDIDLADPAEIAAVRSGIRQMAPGAEVCVVADSRDHADLIRARALGATVTVADQAELLARACTRPGEGSGSGRAALAAAWGAATLDELFDGLRRGGPIDLAGAQACCGEVIDAVHRAGIAGWLDTVRAHHSGTYRHCLLVTGIAVAFGQALRLPAAELGQLALGALLHDIGKAKIPPAILDKPGALDDEERAILRFHAVYGDAYLDPDTVPKAVRDMVRHHHEALDGSGYPDGLRGEAISRPTRMLTISDIAAALVEPRAYHDPLDPEAAYAELVRLAEAGITDAALTAAFAPVIGDMRHQDAPPRSRLNRAQ